MFRSHLRSSATVGQRSRLILLMAMLGAVFLLVLMSADAAWATPPQQGGTVPPPPGKEEEKKETPVPPPPLDLLAVDKVSWTVGPNGGRLDVKYGAQGCLLIDIRPGTLGEEILFEVAARPAGQAPADTCAASSGEALCKTNTTYTLGGWYRRRGQPVGNGPLPGEYVHTICYTEADLALAGGDPHNLVVAFYDDASARWQTVPTSVDTVNRNVSGVTNHLSWWALMVKEPGIQATPPVLPETGGEIAHFDLSPWGAGLLLLTIALIGLGAVVRSLRQW